MKKFTFTYIGSESTVFGSITIERDTQIQAVDALNDIVVDVEEWELTAIS